MSAPSAAQGPLSFLLDGARVSLAASSEPPHRTLLQWLRATGRTASKEGCAEGDCGACTVLLLDRDGQGNPTWRAINACIALLATMHEREIVTAAGLGLLAGEKVEGFAESLHPVQQAMIRRYGSQCGYCTPGFVCSMAEGYYREDLSASSNEERILDQLNGNLCRCTGYRAIRDAMSDALAAKATKDLTRDLLQITKKKALPAASSFAFETSEGAFLRPSNLEELLAAKAKDPEAELVCGATEIGVYANKKQQRWKTLIAVDTIPELLAISATEQAWRIGASVSLTSVEEALAGEYPLLDAMFAVFASRPIRSRASLAGNLVTASPIGDMAPCLLALDATLHLASKERGAREVAIASFFTGYRATVLAKDEVVVAIEIPRGVTAGCTREQSSVKVSKRRELDISIVSAAFVVDVDAEGIVQHARIAYGGVAATPLRAYAAEGALVGKQWRAVDVATANTIAGTRAAVADVLAGIYTPIDDVRAKKGYRIGLIATLFERFFDGEHGPILPPESYGTPSEAAPIAVHEGTAKKHPHESAVGHVTGSARYVDDVGRTRHALTLWPAGSPYARARLDALDVTDAAAMPGVHTVLTAADIPGENDVGAVRKDESLLVPIGGEASYLGHMVAVVVAETEELARAAAGKIRASYTELPPVLGMEEALAAESFHSAGHRIVRGDAAAALKSAFRTISGTLTIGGQEHFYLESHAAFAEAGDDGDVKILSSTQHPSEVQAVVSHVLHLPRHRVVVESPRMGGGFGGKETQGNTWAALVALAACKTKRPVRVQLDRDLDMELTGKRHPFFAKYQVGFDAEGHLSGANVELYNDGGWALDLSESICDRGLFHLDNAYYIPHVDFFGRVLKTHTTSHTAFRGFGGPQGMVVIEEIIDRVARELGLPPEVVRERNLYRGEGETNTTHYGQHLDDNRISRIWTELLESSCFDARKEEIARFNAESPRIKRGIAITPVKFGISFTATFLNQAGALVLIYRDGTVQVNHGGTEMGQGLYTKMLGVAARELGADPSTIRVMKTTTDKVPNTSATAASAGADLNGQAVADACRQLVERLRPVAAELLAAKLEKLPRDIAFEEGFVFERSQPAVKVPFGEVAERAYFQQIALSATGFYRTPGIGYDKAKGKGKPFYYFAYGAAVSEVEIDGYSGMKRVRAVDILHDVGESLNPSIDRGQIEGAFVQGMGWLTAEELAWNGKGRLLSHSASTYQIPSIGDAPEHFQVSLLPKAPQVGTIHGSKAVGEPPLMLAISVREALRDAVSAFGEAVDGSRAVPLGCPATHEAIFAAIQSRIGRAEAAE